jgi:uncharacterized cupredoxin-like copper-binding protein
VSDTVVRPSGVGMRLAVLVIVVGAGVGLYGGTGGHGHTDLRRHLTVDLTVHHSRFQPAELRVDKGTTVTFVVRNTDPIAHELIVGDKKVQDLHERGTEAHHGAVPGEVSVPGGAVASTTYAFSESGTVLLGCHVPGHWDYGMRGTVEVNP